MLTMRGLPVFGCELQEGWNRVACFRDPVKGLTVQPGYVRVKDNRIVAYGQQQHVPLWEDKEVS